jgi:iron complex transport system substrate-binding protein
MRARSWILILLLGLSPAAAAAPPRKVERVVSVVPAGTEMVFAMGAGKKMVGVGTYDRWPPAVASLPRVGALLDPNLELILELRPDLALIDVGQHDLARQLQSAGIRTYGLGHGTIDETLRTMREVGEALGEPEAGKELAARVAKEIDELRAGYRSDHPPRTLLVIGRSPGGFQNLWVVGGKGFMHELLVIAGGKNVFDDVDRLSFKAGLETVLARTPEVVLEAHVEDDARENGEAIEKEWRSLPGFTKVRVALLANSNLGIPGPRMPEVVRAIAMGLHADTEAGR